MIKLPNLEMLSHSVRELNILTSSIIPDRFMKKILGCQKKRLKNLYLIWLSTTNLSNPLTLAKKEPSKALSINFPNIRQTHPSQRKEPNLWKMALLASNVLTDIEVDLNPL